MKVEPALGRIAEWLPAGSTRVSSPAAAARSRNQARAPRGASPRLGRATPPPVAAGPDPSLPSEPEELRRTRAARFDPPAEVDAPRADAERVHERKTRLDAGDAGGVRRFERRPRTMVGRDYVDRAGRQGGPER